MHSEWTLDNRNKIACFLLMTMILLVYSNAFRSSWHLDDYDIITKNKTLQITDLEPNTLKSTFYAGLREGTLYRPIPMLSFALNYYFGCHCDRGNTFGYHVVNTTIHILSALLLFFAISLLLRAPNVPPLQSTTRYWIALLSSLLWAIHPMQTQAVVYIVQRMASMAGMFYIAGLYFYLSGRLTPLTSKKIFSFFLCGVMFLLAMGSKENAVMMPVAVLLIEIVFFDNIASFYQKNRRQRLCLTALICFAGIAITLFFAYPTLKSMMNYSGRPFTLSQRLLTETRVIWFYIFQILYPAPSQFSIDHDIVLSESLWMPWTTLTAVAAVMLILGWAFCNSRKKAIFSFPILFFLLNHLIESTVFPLEIIFEHRNYLPSMFLFLPISNGIVLFLDQCRQRTDQKLFFYICSTGVVILITAIGWSTYTRNADWKTEETLWRSALEKAPGNARPYQNLSIFYHQKKGEYDEALKLHKKALDLKDSKPDYSKMISYYNMSVIYKKMNNFELAAQFAKKAVDSGENSMMILHYIDRLMEAEEMELAEKEIERYLEKDYLFVELLNRKTSVALRLNKYDVAYEAAAIAIANAPSNYQSVTFWGLSNMYLNKYDVAEKYLAKGLNKKKFSLSLYFALITNSLRASDGEKTAHYTREMLKAFPIPTILDEIQSLSKNRYSVLKISPEAFVNLIQSTTITN